MTSQIDELVRMRDAETLYELMTEAEDWLTQFDAAEGLVKLGDRRAFSFLMTAMLSDDDEILEVAQEIIDSTDFSRMREEIEREQRRTSEERLQQAKAEGKERSSFPLWLVGVIVGVLFIGLLLILVIALPIVWRRLFGQRPA